MAREPRAILILLAIAVAGHAARLVLGRPGSAPGAVLAGPPGADPSRHRERALAASRPLGATEQVDLNSATADEIARLPRIGMSLAKRIVEDRAARGAFRGLGDLDRVPGVGPGMLAVLTGRVRFGPAPGNAPASESAASPRISDSYGAATLRSAGTLVDLNSASEAELVALPGIGPARARSILAYRREKGPFAVVSELGRVPGFSQGLVARLKVLVIVR